jgi:hypothetical protein
VPCAVPFMGCLKVRSEQFRVYLLFFLVEVSEFVLDPLNLCSLKGAGCYWGGAGDSYLAGVARGQTSF